MCMAVAPPDLVFTISMFYALCMAVALQHTQQPISLLARFSSPHSDGIQLRCRPSLHVYLPAHVPVHAYHYFADFIRRVIVGRPAVAELAHHV